MIKGLSRRVHWDDRKVLETDDGGGHTRLRPRRVVNATELSPSEWGKWSILCRLCSVMIFVKKETKSTKMEPLLRPDVQLPMLPAPPATDRKNNWGRPKADRLYRFGGA